MNITGKNLLLVQRALDWALDELHNQIATCPDTVEYADDIDVIDRDKIAIYKLLSKVSLAVQKEGLV
jgi:hypothetical protein